MTKTRTPQLPSVPPDAKGALRDFLEAVKQVTEVGEGRRGDQLDRKLTIRDLVEIGIAEIGARRDGRGLNLGGGSSVVPTDPLPIVGRPPPVTGFTVGSAFTRNILSWDPPGYANHSHVEVWRAQVKDIGQAVQVGSQPSRVHIDVVGGGWKGWYWVRNVSAPALGAPGGRTGPFAGPVEAQTPDDPEYMLDQLTGQITETHLYETLNERINLIDGPPDLTGSVAQRLAAEAQERSQAIQDEAAAREQAVADAITALKEYADDESAVAQSFTQLVAVFGGNVAEALTYTIAEVDNDLAVTTTFSQIQSEFSAVDAELNTKASVTYVDEAVSDEESARAESIEQVQARIGAQGDNQVNPLSVVGYESGWSGFWSSSAVTDRELAVHDHDGRLGTALRVVYNGSLMAMSDWFDVESEKIYECSVTAWVGPEGRCYFGLRTRGPGDGGHSTNVTNVREDGTLGSSTSNPYWEGDVPRGQWITLRAYILGSDADPTQIQRAHNVPSFRAGYQLAQGQTRAKLRLLGGYSMEAATHTVYWTNVSVRPISTTTSAAIRQRARVSVDGEDASAQWDLQLQTTVDGETLFGGFGLEADGSGVTLGFNVDRVWFGHPSVDYTQTDKRFPFILDGGVVYLDEASIREAAISWLQVQDGFFDNMTAAKGTLGEANIQVADIFNITVGNVIKSYNYATETAGWEIRQDGGFELNEGHIRSGVVIGPRTAQAVNDDLDAADAKASDAQASASDANDLLDSWARTDTQGNTVIDGGKIATDQAFVKTLMIEDQAVTFPKATYASGSTSVSAGSWSTVRTLSFESKGAPVEIFGVCMIEGSTRQTASGDQSSASAWVSLEARLRFNGNTVYGPVLVREESDSAGSSGTFSLRVSARGGASVAAFVTPVSGTHTIELQMRVSGDGSGTGSYNTTTVEGSAKGRYLRGLETKR